VLKEAGHWFITEGDQPGRTVLEAASDQDCGELPTSRVCSGDTSEGQAALQLGKLAVLADAKRTMRAKLSSCKAASAECAFELTYAVLPPRDLKPISNTAMSALVQNTAALIGACETKFALVGRGQEGPFSEDGRCADTFETAGDTEPRDRAEDTGARAVRKKGNTTPKPSGHEEDRLRFVKPRREIESGDADMLESLLARVRKPVSDLLDKLDRAVTLVIACLGYCYDVSRLPSGAMAPKGIRLEEVDIRLDEFDAAITAFDKSSAEALSNAAGRQGVEGDLVRPEITTLDVIFIYTTHTHIHIYTYIHMRL
jgi:hypothetical protein